MRLPWQKLMTFRVSSFVSGGAATSTSIPAPPQQQQQLRGPFLLEHVRVRLSPAFNRKAHPSAALESSIDSVWQEYKERSPRLFNAAKFRLQALSAQHSSRADSTAQLPRQLVLDWGLTDYKTYLGTCCSTNVNRFVADGKAFSSDDEFAFLSRKVGVAAVVETSDSHIALIKRSKSVGVYQDMYDTPGGHPEPSVRSLWGLCACGAVENGLRDDSYNSNSMCAVLQNVGLTAESLVALQNPENASAREQMEAAAVREFFASIVNEVHEEINLSEAEMSAPLLLGVVYQAEASTPSFSFYMRTARTAAELMELYKAGPMDVFESSKLEFIDAQKLLTEEEDPAFLDRLTPSARGSISLWKEYVASRVSSH